MVILRNAAGNVVVNFDEMPKHIVLGDLARDKSITGDYITKFRVDRNDGDVVFYMYPYVIGIGELT